MTITREAIDIAVPIDGQNRSLARNNFIKITAQKGESGHLPLQISAKGLPARWLFAVGTSTLLWTLWSGRRICPSGAYDQRLPVSMESAFDSDDQD